MRVLIVNTVCEGFSTGKIASSFCEELNRRGHEAILAYGYENGPSGIDNTVRLSNGFEYFVHHVVNAVTGYHSKWAPLPLKRFRNLFEKFKPDLVQLYNLHGYYMDIYGLFEFLSKKRVPIVYGMLDEYAYLGYCAYSYDCNQFKTGCKDCNGIKVRGYLGSWFFNRARRTFLLKQDAYRKNRICFTGPKWVIERAQESALLREHKLYEIDEFVDNDKTYILRDKNIIRDKLGISEDEVMILNVAPSDDPRKGVGDFIEFAKRVSNNKLRFVNVGNKSEESDFPDNYIGVPYVSDQIELSEYYSAADILFCTSHADTMPNVCLEALSCGTPVMGYKVTGVPYVAETPVGQFFSLDDTENILRHLNGLKRKTFNQEFACREYAVKRYSLNTYTDKQIGIYEFMISRSRT